MYDDRKGDDRHRVQRSAELVLSAGDRLDPVYKANTDIVDMPASRRVEIKFRLKEDEMIQKITEVLNQ